MEKSVYDLVVDELVSRNRLVKDELASRFKKTRPFRQEPVSNEELIYNYSQITPEMEKSLRQSMGEDIYDSYQSKMTNLLNRRKK